MPQYLCQLACFYHIHIKHLMLCLNTFHSNYICMSDFYLFYFIYLFFWWKAYCSSHTLNHKFFSMPTLHSLSHSCITQVFPEHLPCAPEPRPACGLERALEFRRGLSQALEWPVENKPRNASRITRRGGGNRPGCRWGLKQGGDR